MGLGKCISFQIWCIWGILNFTLYCILFKQPKFCLDLWNIIWGVTSLKVDAPMLSSHTFWVGVWTPTHTNYLDDLGRLGALKYIKCPSYAHLLAQLPKPAVPQCVELKTLPSHTKRWGFTATNVHFAGPRTRARCSPRSEKLGELVDTVEGSEIRQTHQLKLRLVVYAVI